ncbi:MAG TPA: DUF222 domain-containing protein [Blastococcus sp.]|nr:DUF222 domain-containing protein [Blastococcus sp.]
MFPPGAFGVGVTVAELRPALEDDVVLPEGVVARPSRLGDLLPVHLMTPEQKAANLQRVAEAEAQLAAFKAELVVGLAADRPATEDRRSSQPGAASGEWAAQLLDASVSEFYPDELSHILNCSRAEATRLWEHASTLQLRLPRTWAALADGELDWPRARAIAAELGWPARDSIPAVLAAVEAAVLPQATGLSVTRLRALVRSELLKADAAAADARRKQAERQADVTVRGLGDGMSELRSVMPTPDAAEVRAAADARARELKAAGDERPLGMLRAVVLHELMTRPWQEQPAVSAHVAVVAPLDILEAGAAGAPGTGVEPATVDGQPITAAQARELLERLDALCPGGLQAPTGGSLDIAITDAEGRLLATVSRRELETAVRRGQGLGPPPPVDRYEHSPPQERFVKVRDRTCRQPGCHNRAGWADLDHVVAHADGGETDCANLCCLCRRHHRLKTHARGWRYVMTADGVLSVTTPSGVTRTSRPPGLRYSALDLLRIPSERRPLPDDVDPPPF